MNFHKVKILLTDPSFNEWMPFYHNVGINLIYYYKKVLT